MLSAIFLASLTTFSQKLSRSLHPSDGSAKKVPHPGEIELIVFALALLTASSSVVFSDDTSEICQEDEKENAEFERRKYVFFVPSSVPDCL